MPKARPGQTGLGFWVIIYLLAPLHLMSCLDHSLLKVLIEMLLLKRTIWNKKPNRIKPFEVCLVFMDWFQPNFIVFFNPQPNCRFVFVLNPKPTNLSLY